MQVPANATAEVLLQAAELSNVFENGETLSSSEGVISYDQTEKGIVLTIGSGAYNFYW